MKTINIVIGANYGDEGKGLVTNAITNSDGNSIVVLGNGGAQRGHTAWNNEIRHVFHHFGSATLKGVPSYACGEFILNPVEFRREYNELANLGITPKLYVNPLCRVTTIFDMIANNYREKSKGTTASTGFGIWETIKRYQSTKMISYKLGDLILNYDKWESYLIEIKNYYLNQIPTDNRELFEDENLIPAFIDDLYFMLNNIVGISSNVDVVERFDNITIENGQGLALDTHRDLVYGTPTHTGSEVLKRFLASISYKVEYTVNKYYVTRSYVSRHGDGELAGYDANLNFKDITNKPNEFQGSIRFAHFDGINKEKFISRVSEDIALVDGNNYVVITHWNEHQLDTSFLKKLPLKELYISSDEEVISKYE